MGRGRLSFHLWNHPKEAGDRVGRNVQKVPVGHQEGSLLSHSELTEPDALRDVAELDISPQSWTGCC